MKVGATIQELSADAPGPSWRSQNDYKPEVSIFLSASVHSRSMVDNGAISPLIVYVMVVIPVICPAGR